MHRRTTLSTLIALVATLATLATVPSHAGVDAEALWGQYVIAQKRFAGEVHDYLTWKWLDLTPTIDRQRDQELARIEMQDREFRYLLAREPSRARHDGPVAAMASYEWTDEDRAKLALNDSVYASLVAFSEFLTLRAASDSRAEETAHRMTTLANDVRYQSIVTRYYAWLDTLDTSPPR